MTDIFKPRWLLERHHSVKMEDDFLRHLLLFSDSSLTSSFLLGSPTIQETERVLFCIVSNIKKMKTTDGDAGGGQRSPEWCDHS